MPDVEPLLDMQGIKTAIENANILAPSGVVYKVVTSTSITTFRKSKAYKFAVMGEFSELDMSAIGTRLQLIIRTLGTVASFG